LFVAGQGSDSGCMWSHRIGRATRQQTGNSDGK
jgi:hypothetical protein